MKVAFSGAASTDLEDIGDYIARGNPRRAVTFVQELRAAAHALAAMPKAYPLVPPHRSLGIRRRVFGNFLIFYTIEPDAVVILRILHGARDYEPLLFDLLL